MKKNIAFYIILIGIIYPISVNSSSLEINLINASDPIVLKGGFGGVSPRSLTIDPIQATISSTSLDASFLSNIGVIDVEIYSSSGSTIYSQSVDTQTQGFLTINVTNWTGGDYEIRFTNQSGNYMYGTFEII